VQHNDSSDIAAGKNNVVFTYAPGGSATAGAIADEGEGSFPPNVDVNGDGKITIAHVVHGDSNDGGYYQGQTDAMAAHAEANGWDYIKVDKVPPGQSLETYTNLARGEADLIIAGGAEGTEGFIPIAGDPAFSHINYLLIAGFPPSTEFFSTAVASENHAHFMGGVAMSLLLERSGGKVACITGGPELPFVLNMKGSMLAGMAHAQENYGKAVGAEMLITFTGDFEDAALAVEASSAQFNQGCEIIYPYLGGAMPAVWGAAAEQGVGVVGTSMDLCGIPGLEFTTMSISYNPMYYLADLIDTFVAGDFVEGQQIAVYGAGDGLGIGANICEPVGDEQQILDEVRAGLASGTINVNELLGNDLGAGLEAEVSAAVADPDVNGDGKVVIGIASPGDTNDGGFYQSFVDGARTVVDEQGWELIVSDFINPSDSTMALADLARQGVDFLAVGATELQDGLDEVSSDPEFEDILFYLNSSLAVENPNYSQSSDSYYEIHWAAGVMAAQVLNRTGDKTAGYIGGPELAFSVVAHQAMEAGLQSVISDAELVVVHTGDFNDAAVAIEAAQGLLAQDINVIYAFLGGAMFPSGGAIAGAGGVAFSASSYTCFPGSPFGGSVLFPPGAYLASNLEDLADGNYVDGSIRRFKVGIDDAVGVALCDASEEEQAAIDSVVEAIGSGELVPEDLVNS
jgi:basic membrane protein A